MRDAGANDGDVVLVQKDGRRWQGVLLPHHGFSEPDVLTVKLPSGYNVGIRVDDDTEVDLVEPREPPARPERRLPAGKGLPKVSILGTGGTIASYVDYRTGAVHPATTAGELAFATPEIFDLADVSARVVFQVFSEDLVPANWRTLAREIAAEFRAGARGVVVPHGTDTLGFTGAALSFLLGNLPGPVVLVGAQRSSDRPSSDASSNLQDAVAVAAGAELGEVVVVMHRGVSDGVAAIHRGNRVRKMHSSRRDAFQSPNARPLGVVRDGAVELSDSHAPRSGGEVELRDGLEEDVALVWSHPGLKPEALHLARKGVVLAGTGLGHVANRLVPEIARLRDRGTLVAMATQCLHGRANLAVYSTGRDLLKAGVVSAGDMLPETAYVKLMWALGRARTPEEAAKLFATPMAGEMDERSDIGEFGGA